MYRTFHIEKYLLNELLEVDILWTQKKFVTCVDLEQVSVMFAVNVEAFPNFEKESKPDHIWRI
jgi:hypothetical protein